MKKLYVVILALILLVPGCNKQSENKEKVSSEPENTQVVSDNIKKISSTPTIINNMKIESTSLPEVSADSSKKDTASQFSELLPEGIYDATVLKRIYVYPSAEDEKREKVLEKKFRKGIEALISKEKDEGTKRTLSYFYNKDTPFRSNTYPIVNKVGGNHIYVNKDFISEEEWQELVRLYNSAQENVVEDKKISLNVKKSNGKVIITTDTGSTKYLDSMTIDFSKKIAFAENKSFDEANFSKDSEEYKTLIYALNKTKIKINSEEIEPLFLWYKHIGIDYSTVITVGQLKESKIPVIRYYFVDFTKNKYLEDVILIKS